jgi:hypothetical protein
MNRLYKLSIIGSLFTSLTFAQEQMQNPGFEVWENFGTATSEPENWSSLKTADALASQAPVVIERAEGRQGGFSVRLENKLVLGISANGLLTNGRVHADFDPELGYVYTKADDDRWNTPFVSRPDSLVGWYKFAPVDGDKGKVEVFLHKTGNCRIPENESNPNQLVASARYDILTAQSQWTRFSVPFNYTSTDSPEYILSVVTSGDSTQAVVGSVAYFDDFELVYNPVSLDEYSNVERIKVYQKGESLIIDNIEQPIVYEVYDALGRKVIASTTTLENNCSLHLKESGLYLVKLANASSVVTRKVIFHID